MRATDIEWRGESTLPEIIDGLKKNGRVELPLPDNFNHVLFAHFYPDATPGVEELDIYGRDEILRRVVEINGLDDLRYLIDLVISENAWVRIVTPPRIIITCDEGHDYVL